MNLTRLNTKKLEAGVEEALKHLAKAAAALEPFVVNLNDETRASMARPREAFLRADGGRKFAAEMKNHPEIAAAAGYDPVAVIEDLDNVQAIAGLQGVLEKLVQQVADSKLTWAAEAYVPSLAAYNISRVRAKTDGKLQHAVDALAPVFATHRQAKATAASSASETAPAKG